MKICRSESDHTTLRDLQHGDVFEFVGNKDVSGVLLYVSCSDWHRFVCLETGQLYPYRAGHYPVRVYPDACVQLND